MAGFPIPRRPGSGGSGHGDTSDDGWNDHPGARGDDAYVVDTRRRLRRERRPRPAGPYAGEHGPSRQRTPGAERAEEPAGPRRSGRRRVRWVMLVVGLLVLAWVAFMVWVPFNAWNSVSRVDNAAADRPANTTGHNYLLVGSDSREGLTPEQQQALNASGGDIGKRTDSIILVHVSENGGKPALISIPRDSYVPIAGHGSNKINASFAFGGAKLLTNTVEQATGIYIDGYVEIGFSGFASVVDSLGGVTVCVPFDMKDKDANINLSKGCQTLDGPTSLGYVRARKSDPRGDIGRAERQRQFLGAVMKQAATPSTVLVPWEFKSFADASAKGLIVGDGTTLTDAVHVLQTLRGVDGGDTLSLVVPIENPSFQTPNAGVAVKWNTARAQALFTMLKNDEPLSAPPAGTSPTG